MLLARMLDDKFASLYRMGRSLAEFSSGRGQEALSGATGLALRKGDVLHRDTGRRRTFGVWEPILDAVRTYLGRPLAPCGGGTERAPRAPRERAICHDQSFGSDDFGGEPGL